MKTVIFSGTTEGRRLSEMLSEGGISHHVCVATQYGSDVMTHEGHATVHIGRMDEKEMTAYLAANGFGKGDVAIDATHPYASEVSTNIKNATRTAGCGYIRVMRRSSATEIRSELSGYVNQYNSVRDFAKFIDGVEGNILLTTGSKELREYSENVSRETLSRTYVRVIPSAESIGICDELGIGSSHIIAMQGPFSYEMNRAVIGQYGIKHMLTKDSGDAGGFTQKIEAAADSGISVHVIVRPGEDAADGITVEEAYEKITGRSYRPKRRIVLAGIGPGAAKNMTQEVKDAIRSADAVFGSSRAIDIACSEKLIHDEAKSAVGIVRNVYRTYIAKEICGILSEMVDITQVTILFSGDSGFYSGARECAKEIRKWDADAEVEILPGISSVSYMAAKLGESYDDAAIVSIHGRNSLHNIETLVERIRNNRKTFALMSGYEDVRTVAGMLRDLCMNVGIIIGRDLSGDERICELTVEEALDCRDNGLITVLFINPLHLSEAQENKQT